MIKNHKIKEKYRNKFFVEKYLVTSPHYNGAEKTIFIVSDLHYHPNVNFYIYENLITRVAEIKPDYVLIPGDIIESIDTINDEKEVKKLEYIIKSIAQICPTIIIPGNHEIGDFSSASNRVQINKLCNKELQESCFKFFDGLNRFDNVYFLNNSQVIINDICFLGFNPDISTYFKVKDKATNETFIENYLSSNLKGNEKKYNILLTHSPLLLFEDEVKSCIKDFNNMDLVVTGHMHDGYMPKCLDKYFGNTNIGMFITPLAAPYPGLICRGMHEFGRGFILISQGFRKYTSDNILFNLLEKFTANDVEIITLKHGEKNEVKKVKLES